MFFKSSSNSHPVGTPNFLVFTLFIFIEFIHEVYRYTHIYLYSDLKCN